MSDFAKCETPAQLHIIFEALSKFQLAHGRTPAAWNEKDSELFLACALELNKSLKGSPCHVEELDESLTKIFSYICAGNCCPIQVKTVVLVSTPPLSLLLAVLLLKK